MKDLNELIECFDNLQDLPVSEEAIGAYMEGHLGGAELRNVQNALNSDDNLYKMVESLGDIDKDIDALVHTPISGVETPSTLNFNNANNPINVNGDVLNDTCFMLDNGENIFEIDFGNIDTLGHHNPTTIHDDVIETSLQEFDQLSQTSNDLLTNQ